MSKTKKTTNTSKTTTSTKTTPVNNNSKAASTSTKKTTPTVDKVVAAILTGNTNTKQQTTKKLPPTHSAYHQLGKKRGSYSQNIWVIEQSKDGKKWNPAEDSYIFYKTRDQAQGDVSSLRSGDDNRYDSRLRFRVAKYTFTSVSKA